MTMYVYCVYAKGPTKLPSYRQLAEISVVLNGQWPYIAKHSQVSNLTEEVERVSDEKIFEKYINNLTFCLYTYIQHFK